LPFVTGKEGVAEITAGNERFAPGTRVYFEVTPLKGGACAERVALADSDFIVEVPPGVDALQAAGLGGSTGITAWMSLEWAARLRAGEIVLVLGATGPLGMAAVAIAKILGARRVVAAGRNTARLEGCLAVGADAVVNVEDEKERLAQAFTQATGGGPDVIFDGLSGSIAQCALSTARSGGRLVQMGRASGGDLAVPRTLVNKVLTIAGYANFASPLDLRLQSYRKILDNIALGTIRAIIQTHALADVAHAWESTTGSTYAKVLVEP
jgi:NADPH2:quinone reductase